MSHTAAFAFVFVVLSLAFRLLITPNTTSPQENIFKRDTIEEFVNHCNFLEDIRVNEETNSLEKHGFELNKIIVLIRHGDRAPLRLVKGLDYLFCDKSYLTDQANPDEKIYLDLVDKFFENKQNLSNLNVSSDFTDLPNERCKLARLTKFGVSQHIKLGYLLSEAYSSKLGLSRETLASSLKVTTTKFSRTFQSAFAFLYGFHSQLDVDLFANLPNFTYSVNPYFCGFDQSNHYCVPQCHAISHLSDRLHWSNLLEPDQVQSVKEIVQELGLILTSNGKEASQYRSLVHIFDALNAYMCHRERLPCHSAYGCVSTSHVKDVHAYICLLGKRLKAAHAYKHSSWLKIYGFLNSLIDAIEGPSKFVLYSGHDISLESLQSVLSLEYCSIPPYASRLIFEIYSKNDRQYMRILYNGDDVTMNLEIEKQPINSVTKMALIDLEQFKDYVQRNFEFYTRTKDYKTACGHGGGVSESNAIPDMERVEVR